jgi:hypothetical protein
VSDTLPLFDAGPPLPKCQAIPHERRAVAGLNGRGPAGETCGGCLNCVRLVYHNKTYLKCGLVRHLWTHGPGSDIKASWPSCEQWQPLPVEA